MNPLTLELGAEKLSEWSGSPESSAGIASAYPVSVDTRYFNRHLPTMVMIERLTHVLYAYYVSADGKHMPDPVHTRGNLKERVWHEPIEDEV